MGSSEDLHRTALSRPDILNPEVPEPSREGPLDYAGTAVHDVDIINHPPHYNQHPSGVETIDIVEHFNFNLGNAIKYIWRAGLKDDVEVNLKKAEWYIGRELKRIGSRSGE